MRVGENWMMSTRNDIDDDGYSVALCKAYRDECQKVDQTASIQFNSMQFCPIPFHSIQSKSSQSCASSSPLDVPVVAFQRRFIV